MRIGLGVLDNGPWVIDTSMTAGPLLVQGGGGGTGGASWWWWGSTGWKRGGRGGEGVWAAPGGTPGAPVIVRLVPA